MALAAVEDLCIDVRLGLSVLAEVEGWTVVADPEGNELCAFVQSTEQSTG